MAGPVTIDCQILHVPDTDQRLVVYVAEPGSPSAAALARLRAKLGPLGAAIRTVPRRGYVCSLDVTDTPAPAASRARSRARAAADGDPGSAT